MGTYSNAHICHCLSLLSTLRPNTVVTVAGNRKKTGKEFVDGVTGLAKGLVQLGLQSGDVVSIAAFNSEFYLEWLLAIAYIGAVAAPLNYRWSYEEAVSAMDVVRPAMLVFDDSCVSGYSKLQQNDIPSLRWHVLLDSSSEFVSTSNVNVLTYETIRKQSVREPSLDYCWAPENAVIICFTSGTSGRPKGVALSHSAFIVQSLAKIAVVGYGEEDLAPHVELKVCADGTSNVGRILTRGPHVMLRYWNGSVGNAAAESNNGVWLDTGDIGSIDDYGNVWLVGRANGRIKSGGENVYPEEVERTLLQHPGFAGVVVVVGIPDTRLTEMVVACVQTRKNWQWVNTSTKDSVTEQTLHIFTEILLQCCKEKNLTLSHLQYLISNL